VPISQTFHGHLFLFESFMCSFSPLKVWVLNFFAKAYLKKAAGKMLVKLTIGLDCAGSASISTTCFGNPLCPISKFIKIPNFSGSFRYFYLFTQSLISIICDNFFHFSRPFPLCNNLYLKINSFLSLFKTLKCGGKRCLSKRNSALTNMIELFFPKI